MGLKTFTARIYDFSEQIYQDVICYQWWIDDDLCDVRIKMPILVNPSDIRLDVEMALEENYNLKLGALDYERAPQTFAP